ncbi:MAG TPA: hypothetical protein VD886_14775, partial [Herpetosiphonaceae bacterium]|nr:hypothetical protein [Herpetosiphonaceae bacterium]
MKAIPHLPTQRARTLFVTALILAFGALLDLPIALNAQAESLLIPMLLVMVGVAFGVKWLASRGQTLAGGMILSGMIFVAVALSVTAESLLYSPAGTALIFPILISGLVLGAGAVLVFGALGLSAIAVTPLLSGLAWGTNTSLIMAI